MNLEQVVFIALGSAAGGMARVWMGSQITTLAASPFPWGTLAINVLGSLLIGLGSVWIESSEVRFFGLAGFCGGFTTFSTFSMEAWLLLQKGEWSSAGFYMAASITLCVAAVIAGAATGRMIRDW
jgi:CrcB protein